MPSEGSSVSFSIANSSSAATTFYWYLRQSSGDIRWTDFDGIGAYSSIDSVIQGSQSVAGDSTTQVTLGLALDTLVEEEEAFDVVVSDSQLSLSQIQAAASTASFAIQDATTATISKQSSSEYSTASTSIKDYEIPGGGSFSSTDFNWRSVNTSDVFYVSPEVVVLEDDTGGSTKLELALKDSNGIFRREFTSQEINPNGITYDTLRVREATADTDGNIYIIIKAYQDAFTVFQWKDYLIKINSAGNVVFTKDVSETTSLRDFEALQIDGNGGIVVASYADDYAGTPPSTLPRIDRYDAETGNILWSQRPVLGMDTGSVRISERPIQLLNDGSLLFAISGYIGVEDPTFNTYIIRMDLSTGTPSQMLGIDGDYSYFQNEFVVNSDQLFYRTKYGVYEITTGTNPKVLTYPLSSYVPPSSGVGAGGGGSSPSPAAPAPTKPEPEETENLEKPNSPRSSGKEVSTVQRISVPQEFAAGFDQITGIQEDIPLGKSIGRLYTAVFGRFPDLDGLIYWFNQSSNGFASTGGIAKSFMASPEYVERFGVNIPNDQFVQNLYSNVLGRSPDPEGFNYWSGLLSNGIYDRSVLLIEFANSQENTQLFDSLI